MQTHAAMLYIYAVCCLQLLCNAAKSDKARIQSLEEQIALLQEEAEQANVENVALHEKLQQLQVKRACKGADQSVQGM